MTIAARISLWLLALMLSPLAAAQSFLGELLDAGAKRLSAEEFKRYVVQHALVGPSPTGGTLEVMYASNGTLAGTGSMAHAPTAPNPPPPLGGDWTIDGSERICTSMRIGALGGSMVLPTRCQYWFRLGGAFYVSDSDSDRRAKVLQRTIKSAGVAGGPPSDLGQLLDAGGKRLSADEFKNNVVQRLLTGPMATGDASEIMYVTSGEIRGMGIPGSGFGASLYQPLGGRWTIDPAGMVCDTVRIGPTSFPTRCQAWFRLGNDYYVAESGTDRRATVLRRTVKQ